MRLPVLLERFSISQDCISFHTYLDHGIVHRIAGPPYSFLSPRKIGLSVHEVDRRSVKELPKRAQELCPC